MLSPHFVISEGLGLHAQEILFAGDEAQAWLVDNVLTELGIPAYGDFAGIHRAKNMLWGVWSNAAILVAERQPKSEVAAYLQRWALLRDFEIEPALRSLTISPGGAYIFCYHHGWDLLRTWLDAADRDARVARLLTEQICPAALTTRAGTECRYP